ncbi:hypothetical protein CB1_002524006 [Camelus ferus]|nr:hypothetical protein CB1_002524006 [Camelus ferus]
MRWKERVDLNQGQPLPWVPAAAGAHFALGNWVGLSLVGTCRPSRRLFGAEKHLELWSTFDVAWGNSPRQFRQRFARCDSASAGETERGTEAGKQGPALNGLLGRRLLFARKGQLPSLQICGSHTIATSSFSISPEELEDKHPARLKLAAYHEEPFLFCVLLTFRSGGQSNSPDMGISVKTLNFLVLPFGVSYTAVLTDTILCITSCLK